MGDYPLTNEVVKAVNREIEYLCLAVGSIDSIRSQYTSLTARRPSSSDPTISATREARVRPRLRSVQR